MTGLVKAITKSLVSNPDEVVVTRDGSDTDMVIRVKVARDDMGKVIGKQGRIAKAIRTVVKAAAIKQNIRVSVDIIDDEEAAALSGAEKGDAADAAEVGDEVKGEE